MTRTPVGKIGGSLSHLSAVELGSIAIRDVLEKSNGAAPDKIVMANVVQAGNGQNPARLAAISAGVARETVGMTINDVCLSSLTSVGIARQQILLQESRCVLVGGFESMSNAPKIQQPDGSAIDLLHKDGLWCSLADMGMGPISDAENQRLGITRQSQDEFAFRSHLLAIASEEFRVKEMTRGPMNLELVDEGIRLNPSLSKIQSLQPAFSKFGTITAATASQMSDAGAAGLLVSEEIVEQIGLEADFEVVDYVAVAGRDSSLHLMPAEASQLLLTRNRLHRKDIDAWEMNEAFAGVVLASVRLLGIDMERVNMHGGAIAIGHPLAASGFRMLLSLRSVLRERDLRYGIAAICGGGGQGAAVLVRRT